MPSTSIKILPKIFTYQKADKLKSRKQTQYLFAKGQSMNAFPIKLIYTIESVEQLSTVLPSPFLNLADIKINAFEISGTRILDSNKFPGSDFFIF